MLLIALHAAPSVHTHPIVVAIVATIVCVAWVLVARMSMGGND